VDLFPLLLYFLLHLGNTSALSQKFCVNVCQLLIHSDENIVIVLLTHGATLIPPVPPTLPTPDTILTPFPVVETLYVPPAALFTSVTDPLREPRVVGEKKMDRWQTPPPARDVPQSFDWLKSPAEVNEVMLIVPRPMLVRLTTTGKADVVPTS
jgi:hypothetical protein